MISNILLSLQVKICNLYRCDLFLSHWTKSSVSTPLRLVETCSLQLLELSLLFGRQNPSGLYIWLRTEVLYSHWCVRVKGGRRYFWLLCHIGRGVRQPRWSVLTLCCFSFRSPTASRKRSRPGAPRSCRHQRPCLLVTLLIHLAEFAQFLLILISFFILSLGEGFPFRFLFAWTYCGLKFLLGLHRWVFRDLMQRLQSSIFVGRLILWKCRSVRKLGLKLLTYGILF